MFRTSQVSLQTAHVSGAVGTVQTHDLPQPRFYRPELDSVRFLAFFAVLVHHGPDVHNLFAVCRAACDFGLSMFFLLSGYLITELLLREREQNGTVAWALFFTRRALRIWPLYYAAIALAIALAFVPPHTYWVSASGIAAMSIFCANWAHIGPQLGLLVGHLWSISVEEQFYLIWPPIVKFGGRITAITASVLCVALGAAWLAIFSAKGWELWFDTPIGFMFFAVGALIATATRGGVPRRMSAAIRGACLLTGPCLLLIASAIGGIGIDRAPGLTVTKLYIGYGGGISGCAMIFVAMLGMRNIPGWLIYLGKISYGLYVFHLGMLYLSTWISGVLQQPEFSGIRMVTADGLALMLSIGAAHLSYQYFEKPFLRLKERFAVIQSRPL